MARIISDKKKADSSDGKQGRKEHQKLKSYIVTQYLLKNTDEDHPASAKDIIDYGWLLGFGRRVKILEPEPVVEGFKAYLDKIRAMYEDRPPED